MQIELKLLQTQVGITFIYVTHDQEEALSVSDRIAVMLDGRVQPPPAPERIYDEPATAFVAGFIGQQNFFDGTAGGDSSEVACELHTLVARLPGPDVVPGRTAVAAVRRGEVQGARRAR